MDEIGWSHLLTGGSLHGGRPRPAPRLGEGSKDLWYLFSLSCNKRSRSNIRERRRRRALRSISRVEAMYELRVTKNADETCTNCMTSSGGMGKSSRLLGPWGGSLIFIWAARGGYDRSGAHFFPSKMLLLLTTSVLSWLLPAILRLL